ncbi:MAG: hypothetical protein ACFNTA_05770 [Campylobacter sp.]|uniref:hypothetical protein n=1 Tax=Campylobacter sp. TaxID=205 RepID=UPI00361FE71C
MHCTLFEFIFGGQTADARILAPQKGVLNSKIKFMAYVKFMRVCEAKFTPQNAKIR